MDNLTITLTDSRIIDGYVQAAINNGTTPEALALEFTQAQGKSYADLFKVGIITSAAFVARFTPTEYGDILAYGGAIQPVPDPIPYVPTAQEQADYDAAVATYQALEAPTEEETATYEAAAATYYALLVNTNQAEIDAIIAANEPHKQVAELLNMLLAASDVRLDDPRLVPGLNLLVSLSLLDAARPAVILAYERPTPEVTV